MKTTQAYLFLTLVALALSCTWIPKIDQEDYCYADYAFEAEVKASKGLVDNRFYEYEIYIHTVYKGDVKEKLATDTIFGEGPSNSCGPDVLDEGETYLIYAKETDGKIKLASYRKISDVSDDDIVRMTTKYDCSCEVKFNYDKIYRPEGSFPDLPAASENECNVPEKWCSRNSYCQRNDEGQCTWGELGDCY